MKTKEEKYLENQGSTCPYCNSTEISASGYDADGTAAWSDVVCHDCNKHWTDRYTLTSVDLDED